jgi:hypothetical protein
MRTDEDTLSKGAGGADAGTLRVVLAQGQSFLAEQFPVNSASRLTTSVDVVNSALLVSADPSIQETLLVNNSARRAYVTLGPLASFTNYNFILGAFETFKIPFRWTGGLSAVWDDQFDSVQTITAIEPDFSSAPSFSFSFEFEGAPSGVVHTETATWTDLETGLDNIPALVGNYTLLNKPANPATQVWTPTGEEVVEIAFTNALSGGEQPLLVLIDQGLFATQLQVDREDLGEMITTTVRE